MADLVDEPQPPSVDSAKVLDAVIRALGPEDGANLWRWLTVSHHNWSDDNAQRLKAIHDQCAAK